MRSERLIWLVLAGANAFALFTQWRKGEWLYHADGSVYAHDYITHWAAGLRVVHGQSALVYDWAKHVAFQSDLIAAPKPINYYFLNPPHFLLTTPFFTWLGPVQAYLAFLIVTIVLYAAALNLVARDWRIAAPSAVAGGAAYISLLWVQNGFLTGAMLVFGLAFLASRPALAGVMFGLLTIKPQIGILIPFALIAGGYWRTVLWATGTFVVVALLTEFALGPGIWSTFFRSIPRTAEFMAAGTLWFKMQSPFAISLPLFGKESAQVAQIIVALGVTWIVIGIWRQSRISHWLKCSALVAGSLLVSPYLFAYDAVPLSAAALMLLRVNPNLPPIDHVALFGACLLPGATSYLLSAAGPIAGATMLILVLRQIDRCRQTGSAYPTQKFGSPNKDFGRRGNEYDIRGI